MHKQKTLDEVYNMCLTEGHFKDRDFKEIEVQIKLYITTLYKTIEEKLKTI